MAIAAAAKSHTVYVPQVALGTLAADATDLATALTLLNEVKVILKNCGLSL